LIIAHKNLLYPAIPSRIRAKKDVHLTSQLVQIANTKLGYGGNVKISINL
jgi:hypothetical protein